MYEEFFNLSEKPFSIQPDPSFMFWGRNHKLAYAMLEYGVLNNSGISVITGGVGCGKTTLLHRLLDQLSDTHSVALLSNIQPGRGNLLSWVLMGFNQPFSEKSHVEMFQELQVFFIGEYSKGKRCVLIIDEAQNLTPEMLEEIRMLSNINAGRDQLLQLILVGQPQLKSMLNHPDMLQLTQRIGSDFHLTPLNPQEVSAYIDTRMNVAGAKHQIFSEEAKALIAKHSRGVPRVINIFSDTSLVYAFSAQENVVSKETVESVIQDKQNFGVFGLPREDDGAGAPAPQYTIEDSQSFETQVQQPPSQPAQTQQPVQQKTATPSARPSTFSKQDAFLHNQQAPRAPQNRNPSPDPNPAPDKSIAAGTLTAAATGAAATGVAATGVAAAARTSKNNKAKAKQPLESKEELPNSILDQQAQPHKLLNKNEQAAQKAPQKTPPPAVASNPQPHIKTSPQKSPPQTDTQATQEQGDRSHKVGFIIVEKPDGPSPEKTIASIGADKPIVFVSFSGNNEHGEKARQAGAIVVKMRNEAETPLSRSRNAGFRQLRKIAPDIDYVHFMENGYSLDPKWPHNAATFLDKRPEIAAVQGLPSINKKQNIETLHPSHAPNREIQTCGENLFVRIENFIDIGGFRGDLIVADLQDFCLRIRGRGYHVFQVDMPMITAHAKKKGPISWMRQAVDNGFEYAFSSAIHGAPPERYRVTEMRRAILWGAAFPFIVVLTALCVSILVYIILPYSVPLVAAAMIFIGGLIVYILKAVILHLTKPKTQQTTWLKSFSDTAAHFPEFLGVLKYRRWRRKHVTQLKKTEPQ